MPDDSFFSNSPTMYYHYFSDEGKSTSPIHAKLNRCYFQQNMHVYERMNHLYNYVKRSDKGGLEALQGKDNAKKMWTKIVQKNLIAHDCTEMGPKMGW